MVFIQGTRFTRGGGTNRKGAAGSGQFIVGKHNKQHSEITFTLLMKRSEAWCFSTIQCAV